MFRAVKKSAENPAPFPFFVCANDKAYIHLTYYYPIGESKMAKQKVCTKKNWNQVSFEDKVAMAGNGRAGYEARQRNGYPDSRSW